MPAIRTRRAAVAGRPSAAVVSRGRVVQELRAGRTGGRTRAAWRINLVIDSDTLRTSVDPRAGRNDRAADGTCRRLRCAGPEIPFEERTILDRSTFDSFADRAAREISAVDRRSAACEQFWPLVDRAIASDRATWARAWRRRGTCSKEPVGPGDAGAAAEPRLPACPRFIGSPHICCAELPRLREIYNRSLAEYRRMHCVRSRNHPAPELADDDDWLEAPFWIWSEGRIRAAGDCSSADEANRLVLTDRAGMRTRAAWRMPRVRSRRWPSCPQRRIKLRTRALITTLWARLALGDLFLHGIGGAKYDQLTDLDPRAVLCMCPPPLFSRLRPRFACRSILLRLVRPTPATGPTLSRSCQLARSGVSSGAVARSTSRRGSVRRTVNTSSNSTARRLAWIATPQTRDNARQRCRAIRAVNRSFTHWTAPARGSGAPAARACCSRSARRKRCWPAASSPSVSSRKKLCEIFYWNFMQAERTLRQPDGALSGRRRDSSL